MSKASKVARSLVDAAKELHEYATELREKADKLHEAEEHLEQGALAGPIRADDGQDFTIVGLHGHAVDRGETAKVFLDLNQFEYRHRGYCPGS